jgi:hypothetical protein
VRVTKGQLAILPLIEGRRAERRIVNMAARLREPGATLTEVEVQNLSTDGFMAKGDFTLEIGAYVWLKLAGLEAMSCRVAWVEDDKAGFEFTTALHPATVQLIVTTHKKPIPKRHFGPQGVR